MADQHTTPDFAATTDQAHVVSRPASPASPAHNATQAPNRVDNAFISPRVLDQNAYDSLSEELRAIMSETAARAFALKEAAEHADSTKQELTQATNAHREQLSLTAKLLKALNAKAESVESTLTTIESRIDATSELETNADAVVLNALDKVDQAINERIAGIEAQIETAVNARVSAILRPAIEHALAERLNASGDEIQSKLSTQLESAERRLATIRSAADEAFAALEQRAAQASQDLERTFHTAPINEDTLLASVQNSIAEKLEDAAQDALHAAKATLNGTAKALESKLNEAASTATSAATDRIASLRDDTIEQIATRSANLSDLLDVVTTAHQEMRDELHRGATTHVVRIREAIDDATRLLGYDPTKGDDPDTNPAPNTLDGTVRRALNARDTVAELCRRLDTASSEAGVRADDIEQTVLSAVNVFNDLLSKKGQLDRVMTDAMATADTAIAALTDQQTKTEHILTPIEEARADVERLSAHLEATIDEARTIAQIADTARDELTAANATAASATASLATWKRLLIDADAQAPLPEPLQQIADRFRDEVRRPLVKMASAMSMVASGAEATMTPSKDGAQIVITQHAAQKHNPAADNPQASSANDAPITPLNAVGFQTHQERKSA